MDTRRACPPTHARSPSPPPSSRVGAGASVAPARHHGTTDGIHAGGRCRMCRDRRAVRHSDDARVGVDERRPRRRSKRRSPSSPRSPQRRRPPPPTRSPQRSTPWRRPLTPSWPPSTASISSDTDAVGAGPRVDARPRRLPRPIRSSSSGRSTTADTSSPTRSPTPPSRRTARTLDAAAAAEAAGIDVDVTDLDGSADVSLPGFWTKSCSYGNGAMSLSTLSFNAVEDAQQFYADNLDVSAGVVLDVAVGVAAGIVARDPDGRGAGRRRQRAGHARNRRRR